jgi:hypothetical protein
MALAACGGGSGGGDSTGYDRTFTASAVVGELLTYRISTTQNRYQYDILHSSYNLSGTTTGVLTSRTDGTLQPSEAQSLVYSVSGGLMIAGIKLSIAPDAIVPVIGIGSPLTNVNELWVQPNGSRIYNFISFQCPVPNPGARNGTSCSTGYGTMEVFPGVSQATYDLCFGSNNTNNCTARSQGVISSLGNGYGAFRRNQAVKDSYVMAYKANGRVIGIVDLYDSTGALAYGSGQIIFVEQESVSNSVAGQYAWIDTVGRKGVTTQDLATGFLATRSLVWSGMYSYGASAGHVMFSSAGLYVRRSATTANEYEIGVRMQ